SGLLLQLNVILQTSYTLETPSISSLLENCILKNIDFGTAYSRLHRVWSTDDPSTIEAKLCKYEQEDQERRQNALVGNQIINPRLPPRCVWDLYSNQVVPWGIACKYRLQPISHAWMDVKDRVDVWTPINRKEWPVPIPKDANLDLIRIELLNLGLEYTWLDVLCLRQKGGQREDLHVEEWKLDVPTVGWVYICADQVVIYLSGLGQPLSFKDGDLESDQCWFRRAWTVQEVGKKRIIAGDTPDGPMHAEPIDKEGNYRTEILTAFHKHLGSVKSSQGIFSALADMQKRVSTNPVDKVMGLAFPLHLTTIPPYYESRSLDNAWKALMDSMDFSCRIDFFFLYPEVGHGYKKWRPTWEQLMTKSLPVDILCYGNVEHNDNTDDDWYEGSCIEKGLVKGLNIESAEGVERHGELLVEDTAETMHTFKIYATHKYLIPEDSYTLLGVQRSDSESLACWAVGQRLPGQKFEKVSVFAMSDLEGKRLKDMNLDMKFRNILV
ncbi:hypothetical protein EDD85DRAFT_776684, partial [Armillaria nabsnona]